MASFVYEGLILFGIGLVPGLVGAVFTAQTGHAHPWQTDTALRLFAFVVYGVYFVWFWSARGQTLPMQTWHIAVETRAGERLGQGHALLRYLAAWIWIAPPTLVAAALRWTPWQTLGAVGGWIVVYAGFALLHPQRQFWHDALCRTRLVTRQKPAAR